MFFPFVKFSFLINDGTLFRFYPYLYKPLNICFCQQAPIFFLFISKEIIYRKGLRMNVCNPMYNVSEPILN